MPHSAVLGGDAGLNRGFYMMMEELPQVRFVRKSIVCTNLRFHFVRWVRANTDRTYVLFIEPDQQLLLTLTLTHTQLLDSLFCARLTQYTCCLISFHKSLVICRNAS